HRQVADEPPKITKAFQTLQVYTAEQLKGLLEQNDFKVLRQCNMDGSRFSKHQSERIFTIAKRSHSS
ncbi:MAG: hypothetical protein KDH94_03195, partial [Coxiellaceae bacterium]|nr:hypothetical protein [Coxiellaceae bacterium]